MVQAFEYTLSEERGKNTRLSRTRQKVAKAGVVQTLSDWAAGSQETKGFRMLLERGMPEFTGEAITLRHPGTVRTACSRGGATEADGGRRRLEFVAITARQLCSLALRYR